MTGRVGPLLADLRRRAQDARGARALRELLDTLREDPRAGAQTLAAQIERRLRREREEHRRLARLFALKRRLQAEGARYVAGVDEAGIGSLAGPVVAAAVLLGDSPPPAGLDDSKRIAPSPRERLAHAIHSAALSVAVAEVWPDEIDRLNVYRAGLEAMRRAVVQLDPAPDHVLVDARTIPGTGLPQTALLQGDARDGSIAAASIVAKVHRDALMCQLDRAHPGYGFAQHKGYGTEAHLNALRRLGPSRVHRRSFAPVVQLSLV